MATPWRRLDRDDAWMRTGVLLMGLWLLVRGDSLDVSGGRQ